MAAAKSNKSCRNLVLVLGDQLNLDSEALADFDPDGDLIWMAEVDHEATYVWSHKQRLALFFSAMRHFRDRLLERDFPVLYHELTRDPKKDRGADFATILAKDIKAHKPDKIVVTWPGDFRVKESLANTADKLSVEIDFRHDNHFYCSLDEFAQFAKGRKLLLLETFYRQMRKKHDLLLDDGEPAGGEWNYDDQNRESFGRDGPGKFRGPHSFRPDDISQDVFDLIEQRFGDHPGSLEDFNMPVTHEQAQTMLREFVERSLPLFGKYEDAMWTEEAFLYHSRLSAPLNLKLFSPRACVEQAIDAYESGHAPLNSVEGFVRQIVGWREFIRGVYWLKMPSYAERNFMRHQAKVPQVFWDGETDMRCVQESMKHVLQYGYAHHIHRLMVLGNFALLLGVHPYDFHEWHMAMYLDAVDWVSLPNALGMSQHADGGIVGTKPYVSTGNYIHRMSNFCRNCPYDYKKSVGEDACPITTLYWDFLDRHYKQFENNHRMGMQLKHVDKKRQTEEIEGVRQKAAELKERFRAG